jgi:hypothetical protein
MIIIVPKYLFEPSESATSSESSDNFLNGSSGPMSLPLPRSAEGQRFVIVLHNTLHSAFSNDFCKRLFKAAVVTWKGADTSYQTNFTSIQ